MEKMKINVRGIAYMYLNAIVKENNMHVMDRENLNLHRSKHEKT